LIIEGSSDATHSGRVSELARIARPPKARGILHTYFAGQPPAGTLCILRGLANPNFLLEIEAIAAV
jgi:enamine deaminase RidA (YjgF/YER057c/UK114 family)